MGLKFRYNDKTYSLYNDNWNSSCSSPDYLVFSSIYNYPVPASASRGTKIRVNDNGTVRRYIDNSAPTICFCKNNKTYYCAKSLTQVYQRTVSYSSNGGSGSMDSQTFYPDDGESVAIKANAFSRSGYSFVNWNTSSDGSGTSYSPGAKYSGSATINLYAQWKINFSASGWASAYSRQNTYNSFSSNYTTYNYYEHYYVFSVKVAAPSTNKYDFTVSTSSYGIWTISIPDNPDITMGAATKTLSVTVRIRATSISGNQKAEFTVNLRDRTNSANTVVSSYKFSATLLSGTSNSEE